MDISMITVRKMKTRGFSTTCSDCMMHLSYIKLFLYFSICMWHLSYIKFRREYQLSTLQKVLLCEERMHAFHPKELYPFRAGRKSYLHYIQVYN
jgi:hypothetical protein